MMGFTVLEAVIGLLVVLAPVLLVGFLALVVVTNVRRSRAVRDAGLGLLSVDAQVRDARAPERSAEARLAEAQDLYRRGLVTADEHGEMRQRILGEV